MTFSSERARWLALYVLCAGMLMIVLDTTVVNVALPYIQDDLGFTSAGLAWVVNAYMIPFAGLLLLSGRLGDLLGRRTMFVWGVVAFTAASVLCGLAGSRELLVAARFAQGAGGAMASAVILGMIVTIFDEPAEQGKAMGVYGFVASGGGSVGLLAGGVLTHLIDWHWIFFVNVPIGIATVVLARRLLPADEGLGWRSGADAVGAVLVTGALMLTVYTIVGPASSLGWGASRTLLLLLVCAVLMGLFVARQATAGTPLVPLAFFRNRGLVGANLIQVLTVAGMFGMFFLGSLYVERILHYDALQIGLAFLPSTLVMGTMSLRFASPVMMRLGARATVVLGLALCAAGLGLFAPAPVDGSYLASVLPAMLLIGLGAGVSFPALMTLSMAGVRPEDSGLASGVVNTMAEAGGALGLAVLATLAGSRTSALADRGVDLPHALTSGYRLAFWVSAALMVLAVLVARFVVPDAPAAPQGDDATDPELVAVA